MTNFWFLYNKKCIPNCNIMLLHVNDENKWWGLCLHFRFHMIIIDQYDGEVSNLAPFFSPLLIAVLFLQQRRLLINPQWGSPSLWITCTWAQGRKWLWHHSSANPLLSEKIFRYIYQKINVQININVIELKWVEHNTTTHYLTIKH